MTRGERNANPGNIRKSTIPWQGMAEKQPDSSFVTFTNAMWGIRAICKILLSYQRKHGLNTVHAIIDRWAPPSENDTSAYVAHVANVLNVGEDAPINLQDDGVLEALTRAIIAHENGRVIYSDAQIKQGVESALEG